MDDQGSEIHKLIDDYVANLIAQERILSEGGGYRVGNAHADAYTKAQQELFAKYGDAGREAFSILLDHDNPAIRGDVAAVLLRYKHDKAMRTLKELATRHELGLTCAGAQATIARWEDGLWDLDPLSDDA